MNQVDEWNASHPIGTPVLVQLDNGTKVETHTRSLAVAPLMVQCQGLTPVIWLRGIPGCHALNRVTPVVEMGK